MVTNRGCKPGKHKYEARYDEEPIEGISFDSLPAMDMKAARRLYIVEKYIKDICVKCGDVIIRKP